MSNFRGPGRVLGTGAIIPAKREADTAEESISKKPKIGGERDESDDDSYQPDEKSDSGSSTGGDIPYEEISKNESAISTDEDADPLALADASDEEYRGDTDEEQVKTGVEGSRKYKRIAKRGRKRFSRIIRKQVARHRLGYTANEEVIDAGDSASIDDVPEKYTKVIACIFGMDVKDNKGDGYHKATEGECPCELCTARVQNGFTLTRARATLLRELELEK